MGFKYVITLFGVDDNAQENRDATSELHGRREDDISKFTLPLSGHTNHASVRDTLASRLWKVRTGNRHNRSTKCPYRS